MDWEGEGGQKIIKIWVLTRVENRFKNQWILRSKCRRTSKKTLLKTTFFSMGFFQRFGLGFGMVLGGFWEGFGAFLASFGAFSGIIFGCLYLECPLEGLLEAPGTILARFWGVWEGSGEDFGRVLGGFGVTKLVFFLIVDFTFLGLHFLTPIPSGRNTFSHLSSPTWNHRECELV